MTYERNVRAILDCHFGCVREELIDNAVKCIVDLKCEQEPCEDVPDTNVGDIISRQAAIDALSHMCSEDENGITVSRANVNSMLRALSPVNPQEPKTGHWEYVQYDYNPNIGNWNCSACKNIVVVCVNRNEKGGIPIYNYCPNCGAKMG